MRDDFQMLAPLLARADGDGRRKEHQNHGRLCSKVDLLVSYVYVQRLICWFGIGFGRLEPDVQRDIAKICKTRLECESGELF